MWKSFVVVVVVHKNDVVLLVMLSYVHEKYHPCQACLLFGSSYGQLNAYYVNCPFVGMVNSFFLNIQYQGKLCLLQGVASVWLSFKAEYNVA